MLNWEYTTVNLEWSYDDRAKGWVCEAYGETFKSIDEALDVRGSQGWELVNITLLYRVLNSEHYRMFFKAPQKADQ